MAAQNRNHSSKLKQEKNLIQVFRGVTWSQRVGDNQASTAIKIRILKVIEQPGSWLSLSLSLTSVHFSPSNTASSPSPGQGPSRNRLASLNPNSKIMGGRTHCLIWVMFQESINYGQEHCQGPSPVGSLVPRHSSMGWADILFFFL